MSGVSVYQAAFLPVINAIFPDHTVEQSNHINDFGFSTSTASKVIVPIQGASSVIAFVEALPIEQSGYAWCGNKKLLQENAALEGYICNPMPGTTSTPATTSNETVIKKNKFKNWQPAAFQELKEHTHVIVGGVHIQEVKNNQIAVSTVECPPKNGSVDLEPSGYVISGKLSCPIAGVNLNLIKKVFLELDTKKVMGDITDNGNGKTGAIVFSLSDLDPLTGIFKLYTVDAANKEFDTGQTLVLAAREPKITETPEKTDLAPGKRTP